MDEERMRVLKMLEEDRINAEQAAGLLAALEGARTTEPVASQEKPSAAAEGGARRDAEWSELAQTLGERVATAVERAQAEGRDWATLGRELSSGVRNAIHDAFGRRGLQVDKDEPQKSNYTSAKLTRARLSRMSDNIAYTNYGKLVVAEDVPEDLLAQKIASYQNYGRTIAPANLLGVLEGRCDNNFGAFLEPEEEGEQQKEEE